MNILINLEDSVLSKIQKLAYKEDRSRKQMLDLIIRRHVEDEKK